MERQMQISEDILRFMTLRRGELIMAFGAGGGGGGRRPFFRRRKTCPFSGANAPKIDYKDVKLLSRYVSERGKIVPSRITAVSAKKQRELAQAIKRSRFLGLLPYVINGTHDPQPRPRHRRGPRLRTPLRRPAEGNRPCHHPLPARPVADPDRRPGLEPPGRARRRRHGQPRADGGDRALHGPCLRRLYRPARMVAGLPDAARPRDAGGPGMVPDRPAARLDRGHRRPRLHLHRRPVLTELRGLRGAASEALARPGRNPQPGPQDGQDSRRGSRRPAGGCHPRRAGRRLHDHRAGAGRARPRDAAHLLPLGRRADRADLRPADAALARPALHQDAAQLPWRPGGRRAAQLRPRLCRRARRRPGRRLHCRLRSPGPCRFPRPLARTPRTGPDAVLDVRRAVRDPGRRSGRAHPVRPRRYRPRPPPAERPRGAVTPGAAEPLKIPEGE
ncbi:hypothetical protein Lal_00041408 [Lupinus albus]|nr:hypothetical protein Lal_00041408 [Lupinus albus]